MMMHKEKAERGRKENYAKLTSTQTKISFHLKNLDFKERFSAFLQGVGF